MLGENCVTQEVTSLWYERCLSDMRGWAVTRLATHQMGKKWLEEEAAKMG